MAITSIKTGSSFTNLVKYNDFLAGNPAFSPSSYESIASVTATGGETTLSFTSIPSTYKHLQIRGISRNTTANTFCNPIKITFNGASTSFTYHYLYGDGSAATAGGSTSTSSMYVYCADLGDSNTASTFGSSIIDIIDYASTTKNKTIKSFSGSDTNTASTTYKVALGSGSWMSTSAITSISIDNFYNFKANSTFALYGIKG